MTATPSRRELLRLATVAAATAASGSVRAVRPVRAGLVVPAGHAATPGLIAGASFGATEATRLSTLMGMPFSLEIAEAEGPERAAAAARRMAGDGRCVLGGVDAATCRAIAAAVPAGRYLELRARETLAPREAIREGALALTPSWETHAAALLRGLRARGVTRSAVGPGEAPWRPRLAAAGIREVAAADAEVLLGGAGAAAPGVPLAGVTLEPGPGVIAPVAWHETLRRYGAAQLNARFRTATGTGMDEHAWYGWVAVKLVVESGLRGQPLAAMRLDGHKGASLHFADGRLAQPLYVVVERDGRLEVVDA